MNALNRYTVVSGQDQNGQTIKQYTNNNSQCNSDCNSNGSCQGMVTNGSNCWTIKGFPSPYSKSGSTTYKKNPPTNNFSGYTTIVGKDQDGQTIKNYVNNQSQCISDCNTTNNCQGTVINGTNCWTIKSFPSPYNNPGSATYKKNPPTNNIDGYNTIVGQDQNGQTIRQYTNQQQCIADCNPNTSCKGAVINGSNCWTIKDFPSPYNNPGSTTYKKIVYPTPAVTSSNFPTTNNNNNMFSSVFCKNTSTNNGFIKKPNTSFNNLSVYKTQSTPNEDTCLNNCKNDGNCSSYSFQNNTSSSNCLLYNKVPSSITSNITANSGYKNNYKYDFNNLDNNQKNVIRKDCLNNYFNNQNNTNLDYSKYYNIDNNNSNISFNAQPLASDYYERLNKVKVLNNRNNIDSDLIKSITNEDLNNYAQNIDGYLQSQKVILNSLNDDNTNNQYKKDINNQTNIDSSSVQNTMLQQTNEDVKDILNIIESNESFENYNIESNNIIKFYLYILIVIILLFLIYYLKKKKYF
jgi:hypothetical protein